MWVLQRVPAQVVRAPKRGLALAHLRAPGGGLRQGLFSSPWRGRPHRRRLCCPLPGAGPLAILLPSADSGDMSLQLSEARPPLGGRSQDPKRLREAQAGPRGPRQAPWREYWAPSGSRLRAGFLLQCCLVLPPGLDAIPEGSFRTSEVDIMPFSKA